MNPVTQIVDPTAYPGWDDLVLSTADYSFFHSSAWAKTLAESYGYKPLYFAIVNDKGLLAAIPLMEVVSIFTGRRGVSLPFSDYCEPLIIEKEHYDILFSTINKYASVNKWKYIELRGGKSLLDNLASSTSFYNHILDLDCGTDAMLRRLKSRARNGIRKAIKENIECRILYSLDSLAEFYRMNAVTRREHGLPSQPFWFFRNVHKHIVEKRKGMVVLASFEGKVIAGAVFFHMGKRAIFKYSASSRKYLKKRPNNAVLWEAIRWYAENGFETMSLGRTSPDHRGLLQFKRGWATTEDIVSYHRYDLRKRSFVEGNSGPGLYPSMFRNMPVPLLKWIGALAYRHFG